LAQRDGQEQSDGRTTVLQRVWRAECDRTRRVSTAEEKDSRTTAFRRAFTGLMDKGLVRADDDLVWLPVEPGPAEFDDPDDEDQDQDHL
jgi:hypothetical protein